MFRTEKDKRGYIPIVIGFFLIVLGIVTLILELQNANLNGYNPTGWLNFYDFWVIVISFCFIAGAFFVVIGIFFLRRITKMLSYALLAAGFALIIFEVSRLLIVLGENNRLSNSGIGWSDFQSHWSLSFFSFLATGVFLIVLGVILGLRFKFKVGYVILTVGFAVMLVGASVLAANLATSLNYYPPNYYFSLQEAWNTTISYFLMIGTLIIAMGTVYLIIVRIRNRRNQEDRPIIYSD